MKSKTKEGIALMAIIFGVIATPIAFDQTADAIEPDRTLIETPNTFFLRGDLTAPSGDAPFGGEDVGKYLVKVNESDIRALLVFDSNPSEGMVYEGWLVDMATGYKLSLGEFDDRNHLYFSQTIVNPWIYDVLVVTEEPMGDTDPSPHTPVGGVLLEAPFGQ